MYEDDAENARAALRALWSASGQMSAADNLGQESASCAPPAAVPGDVRSANNDGKGGLGGEFGSDRHNEIGLAGFGATNEATFDRGEAASKLRDAWRSTLTAEGKMGSSKASLGKTAKETTARAATVAAGNSDEGEA